MSRLPVGYLKLSHIESTGTQHIDTEYAWRSENVRVEIGFELTAGTGNSLFGSEINGQGSYGLVPYVYNGQSTLNFYVGKSMDILPTAIALNTHYDMVCEAKNNTLTVTLNGVEKSTAYTGTVITGVENFLFANSRSGTAQELSKMKVKYFRMIDDGELVRDYTPSINPSGVVSLFETVDGVFYGNAGTGAFVAGDLVIDGDVVIPEKSLGMNFARRRMMAAAKKEPKYVWAVYAMEWVRDDASAITGSVGNLFYSYRLSPASAYTVGASGFTLTNPQLTQVQRVAVGQYLVSLSTGSSIVASGPYLYEVTRKSGIDYFTISYIRYTSVAKKGTTELYRVDSDTLDYPVDGEQDGLWYVLIKGDV